MNIVYIYNYIEHKLNEIKIDWHQETLGCKNVDPQPRLKPRGTRLLRVKIGHDNCIAHE